MAASGRVVVGFDASREAHAAVRYAAARLGHGGTLIAVYAEPPSQDMGSGFDAGLGGPMPLLPEAMQPPPPRPHGEAVFNELPKDTIDGVQLECVVVADRPARALIAVAQDRDADEIVIGTRRHGRLRAAISSVSHDLIHDSDRPVVIVPPPDRP